MNLADRIMADARSTYNPCVRCGSIGTTCGRHYAGIRQHRLGKGRGIKCHPLAVADLCNVCDAELSEGAVPKMDINGQTERSEEFLFYAMLSNIRRIERGVLCW